MKKKMVGVLLLLGALALCGAAPVYQGPVKAEEVHVRQGVGNFLRKIADGKKEIVVAYLGGSITEMGGWRNLTTDWLRKTYPRVAFKEVAAAIGGTGSDLGVFRVGHDALRHDPDLLFVEFATNDAGGSPASIWSSMEGIVRQTWRKDATTDIVFTYTITAPMMGDYGKGVCPRAASAMEQLADHYGIPSIGFGPRVAAEVKAGRLAMTPDDQAKAPAGTVLFAKDGVHPAPEGHAFYLQSIIEGFTQLAAANRPPVDHAAQLATAFVSNNLEAAKMVEIEPAMLKGSWEKLAATDGKARAFSHRMGRMWHAGQPGDKLAFTFSGSCCCIYDLLGPDGGDRGGPRPAVAPAGRVPSEGSRKGTCHAQVPGHQLLAVQDHARRRPRQVVPAERTHSLRAFRPFRSGACPPDGLRTGPRRRASCWPFWRRRSRTSGAWRRPHWGRWRRSSRPRPRSCPPSCGSPPKIPIRRSARRPPPRRERGRFCLFCVRKSVVSAESLCYTIRSPA